MALDLPAQPNHDDDAVRHLVELGYVDPEVVAVRDAMLRRELEAEFQQALKAFERGDLTDAAQWFEKLAATDPTWVAPRQLLAEIYFRLSDFPRAEEALEWLTLHAVEHPRLALIGGAIALSRRNMPEALGSLKYAAHIEPELPSVHTLLGTTLFRLGRLYEAKESYERALVQRRTDAGALDGLAAIYLRESNFEDAANASLEALDHDMQLFRAHYHLGIVLARLNRPNEALTALETAAKINPNGAAPYRWLARIAKERLNDANRAQEFAAKGTAVVRRRIQSRLARRTAGG